MPPARFERAASGLGILRGALSQFLLRYLALFFNHLAFQLISQNVTLTHVMESARRVTGPLFIGYRAEHHGPQPHCRIGFQIAAPMSIYTHGGGYLVMAEHKGDFGWLYLLGK